MLAVKEKIETVQKEIEVWKNNLGQNIISPDEELLPDTYIKLRFPDDEAAQANAI